MISLLGAIFVILALIAIYQSVRASWSLYYGAILLIVGAVFVTISNRLTRKYVKPTK